ncbi:MAG: hypothetical protein ACKV2V_16255 [Blastocatellia bacterium]
MSILITLTTDERRGLLRAGDRARVFTKRTIDIAERYPAIVPPAFSVEEMRKDDELADRMEPIRIALAQFLQMVDDTGLLARTEGYASGLSVYAMVKANAKALGLESVEEEQGRLFIRRPSNGKKSEAKKVKSEE